MLKNLNLNNFFFLEKINISYLFPNTLVMYFCIVNYKLYIITIIKNTTIYKLLLVPVFLNFIFTQNCTVLTYLRSFICLQFINIFLSSLTTLKVSYRQLVLKGGGYKVILNSNTSVLELKIGYTHRQYIIIPKNMPLFLIILKNNIFHFSYNMHILGQFVGNLRSLKKPNAYTEKGIFYYNQKYKIKTVVKKK